MKKIILLGYMGSGKTTIAHFLAKALKMQALDLDKIIEQKTERSIKALFENKGEIFFRKLEHEIFGNLISNSSSMVLALGGGTPCYANNHELLNAENVVSIYLKASIGTLYERLINDKENRPLIAHQGPEEIRIFIAKHLFDRSYYYHQATHVLSVDGKSIDVIVAELQELLT